MIRKYFIGAGGDLEAGIELIESKEFEMFSIRLDDGKDTVELAFSKEDAREISDLLKGYSSYGDFVHFEQEETQDCVEEIDV